MPISEKANEPQERQNTRITKLVDLLKLQMSKSVWFHIHTPQIDTTIMVSYIPWITWGCWGVYACALPSFSLSHSHSSSFSFSSTCSSSTPTNFPQTHTHHNPITIPFYKVGSTQIQKAWFLEEAYPKSICPLFFLPLPSSQHEQFLSISCKYSDVSIVYMEYLTFSLS